MAKSSNKGWAHSIESHFDVRTTPKKRGATKFRKHRLAGGFDGVKLKRGFIPNKLKATDKPYEIMDIYGVSYGTACVWLRILRGPNYMP